MQLEDGILKKNLQLIEDKIVQAVHSDLENLAASSLHLIKAGGKRLRPLFVLLAGMFGNSDMKKLHTVAVSLELIHLATLVHDDVIDDADKRRGQLTVKAKWNNQVAMFTGDYIYARALTLISELKEKRISRILAPTIVQVCLGEIEQIRDFFNLEQSISHYLRRTRRKTALLFAISCQLGAIVTKAPQKISNALYGFGYNVGMAFQIKDDILDFCGSENLLGKPQGSDLRQGNITLPVLYALQDKDKDRVEQLQTEIKRIHQAEGAADCNLALKLVRDSFGISTAEQLAKRYVKKAFASLAELPDLKEKENLMEIAKFSATRDY